jgi:hypothetical protein
MKRNTALTSFAAGLALVGLAATVAMSATDKYTLKVPGGIAFSEFRGYESWEVVSLSKQEKVVAAILGNPVAIAAFKSGIPENGKPFPDGAKMVKVHWLPKVQTTYPGPPTVPGQQLNADFMMKDAKRFADSNGWGYAKFDIDLATGEFRPGDEKSTPPQGHDAKCGAACHVIAKSRDYVFTEYAKR